MTTPTTLTQQELHAIIARRDPRYDGRLYIGVKTTGIYCRPVCSARPKIENVRTFRSATEAEHAGFRPCLRCRPDAAPGSKLFDGTLSSVSRALRLIAESDGDELTVAKLATTLGMTDRHLRRLFDEHLGASPVEIMITNRLHFAKQTLAETDVKVADLAFASGFQSLRRFNEAFRERYRMTPTAYRKARGAPSAKGGESIRLQLPIRKPYDFATVLAYLERHAAFGIEWVQGGVYRRAVPIGKSFGLVEVAHLSKKADALTVTFRDVPLTAIRAVTQRLKALFDTAHDPTFLRGTATLRPAGIRVPGSFDPFETAVSIVLSQLVSTAHAKTMLRRVIEMYGAPLGAYAGEPVFAFPSAKALAVAPLEELGVPKIRAAALRSLATAVAAGKLDFRAHAPFDETEAALLAIRGIGPWTASMIAMRVLGDPDAFPAGDLIVKRALDDAKVDPNAWTSARAYLVHCLWRDAKKELS